MLNQFSRTQLIFGIEAMEKLSQSCVAIFGVGGVGGYTIEALARSGVGAIDLIDDDRICLTNLNRQLLSTRDTVGQYKVDVAEKRIHSINPDCKVITQGNKVNAAAFEVADIYETSVCPLARVMRYECRKRGIDSLKVVYSKEKPIRPLEDMSISCRKHCICPPGTARKCTQRRDIPGSTAFVPSAAGLIIAGEVIKDLIEFDRGER